MAYHPSVMTRLRCCFLMHNLITACTTERGAAKDFLVNAAFPWAPAVANAEESPCRLRGMGNLCYSKAQKPTVNTVETQQAEEVDQWQRAYIACSSKTWVPSPAPT